jgi:CheY-like chemotaxis protein
VLWVDDQPENNQYERRALRAVSITITVTLSTGDALARLQSGTYDAVISDMGRGMLQRHAGYMLLEKMRHRGIDTPYIIYTFPWIREDKAKVCRLGGYYTTRPADLFECVINAVTRSAEMGDGAND